MYSSRIIISTVKSWFSAVLGNQQAAIRSQESLSRAHHRHITTIQSKDDPENITRPTHRFMPSPWGDRFLDYTPNTEVIKSQNEMSKQLKEDIDRELLSIGDKPLIQQLRLIDSAKRLGVAYHFENHIQKALQCIYQNSINPHYDNLELVSLQFRLLRQHGFQVSPGVFREFIYSNGSLKEGILSDICGILGLYEACYVRTHGEDILEKALPFIIINLNRIASDEMTPSLVKERIRHALFKPMHRRVTRYECPRYLQVYQEDDPLHNKSLLKFAKLDYNLLQASYKEELSYLSRYWKCLDIAEELRVRMRDRVVEVYVWSISAYSEPQYSIARKVAFLGGHVITSIDDVFDAYATFQEMELFTQAVERWDKSCLDEVPMSLRQFYQSIVLDVHEEMERLLVPLGRSRYVEYAKKEIKSLCRSYLMEARWRQNKVVPPLEEYIENCSYRNSGYISVLVYIFLGVEGATDDDFEWICNLAPQVKAASYHLRILNDLAGNKFDTNRGLSNMFMDCYMKEHNLSYEEACEQLRKKADDLWKDINQPSEIANPLNTIIFNLSRVIEIMYEGGVDHFTAANKGMKQIIQTLFVDSVPI